MAKIETNIDNIKSNLQTHCDEQREDFQKISDKLDAMHNSFAGKWVEKVSVGVLITAIAGIIIILIQNLG